MNSRLFSRPGARPSAGILLQARDTGRVLLGRRSEELSGGGLWALFGGGIEEGESPAQAALRELHEEAGIRCEWLMPLRATGAFHAFLGRIPHEVAPTLNWENSDARWFSPHRLPQGLYKDTLAIVGQVANAGQVE